MLTIGFANKYYTLWDVSEVYTEHYSKYSYREKQDFNYIQNLSMDLDKAKAKLKDKEFKVDLELRGSSSYTTEGKIIDTRPENVFRFGKYGDKNIEEIDDLSYIFWYYGQTNNLIAKNVLLKNGYKEVDNVLYTEEEYKNYLDNKKQEDYLDSLESGHFHENGEKVELKLKQVDAFTFDGAYGTTVVMTFASEDGKKYKYMGSNPPDIYEDAFYNVKATIKHDSYNGIDETKLLRIKVV